MNEIKDGKMYDKILEAKEKIDGVFIPDRTWNTIVERQKVIANVTNLLDDTANQHSGWSFVWRDLQKTSLVDNFMWEMLLEDLSEEYNVGIPLLKNLVITLNVDPMERNISVDAIRPVFFEDTDLVTSEYVMAAFYGVDMGWWTEEEARFVTKSSQIPIYDDNSKKEATAAFLGVDVDELDNVLSIGNDVFLVGEE